MCSRRNGMAWQPRCAGWLPSLLLACALQAHAQARPEELASSPPAEPAVAGAAAASAVAASAPSRATIEAALAQVRQDPDLVATRKAQRLRFKFWNEPEAEERKKDPSPEWLVGFAKWLSASGRVLVWVLGAALVGLLLVSLRRWLRWRAEAGPATMQQLPSHVRDLDIRPDSLPADVGAAARALWQRGDERGALSLLYRGALSRLVHRHRVAIRAASTEGDCLRLAAGVLPREPAAYFARLVGAWQLAVYAARRPQDADVIGLCTDFDGQLGGPEEAAA